MVSDEDLDPGNDPANWDCCDEHETVFWKGTPCPKCEPEPIKEQLMSTNDPRSWAPCIECEERAAVQGEEYCPDCRDNLAEAAHERQMEAFYGGGEPVTMDEMHRAAWEEKQRLR